MMGGGNETGEGGGSGCLSGKNRAENVWGKRQPELWGNKVLLPKFSLGEAAFC